jgi:hypothetical protein
MEEISFAGGVWLREQILHNYSIEDLTFVLLFSAGQMTSILLIKLLFTFRLEIRTQQATKVNFW